MKQILIFLTVCIATLNTGCTLLKMHKGTVDYHKLEGLTVAGEGWSTEYKYPNQIEGVDLASFDFNLLSPLSTGYCKDLRGKAGNDLSCFGSWCNSLAMEYRRTYKYCHQGIADYQKEERMKDMRAYVRTQNKARTDTNKNSAIAFMDKYADINNLTLSKLKYYYQPLSIEYVMGKIKKGEFKAPMYFNVKCCGGYKVSQPIDGGYMLTTENYGGLPIMLKTSTTLFEGNKAGRSLGWLKYEGVTKYKTAIGTDRQAILMAEIQ
jgi:hypothetical protein